MTLLPGARLGPYEIVAAIGAGGMGEVFRARDTKLNRDVAIKVYRNDHAEDSDKARVARKMFLSEAHMVGMLQHPQLMPIYAPDQVFVAYVVNDAEPSTAMPNNPHPARPVTVVIAAAVGFLLYTLFLYPLLLHGLARRRTDGRRCEAPGKEDAILA